MDQKSLHRVTGPEGIVISNLVLITFSDLGLLLDAQALRVAWRTGEVSVASCITRNRHPGPKSTWSFTTATQLAGVKPFPSQDPFLFGEKSMALMGSDQSPLRETPASG